MQASSAPFQEQNVPQQMPPNFPPGGMTGGSIQQQMAALSQHTQVLTNNQINPLQRPIQAQDHLNARPLNILLAQGQQQQNGSSFTSRVGQNLHPSGMGLPQGQGSLQQNFVQRTPPVSSANLQPSSAPSSQAPSQGGQQIYNLSNIAEASVPQLCTFFNQLKHAITEGEKNLHAAGNSGGEVDPQRQALRAKLESQKQVMLRIREMIAMKTGRPSGGDSVQQAVNGATWVATGQRPVGHFPVAERPPQHDSPSLHQASVNQVAPQRSIPTPQQSFVPSATPQPNMTQISPHVSASGLPFNGALAAMAGAPPQQSPQITHPPPQQPIQANKLAPLTEDRFKFFFAQFARSSGIRSSERDFTIDGRQINPWILHRAVFSRGGFDLVTTNDEWPIIGIAVGFPAIPAGDMSQPPRCAPVIAQRLRQLYHEFLRQFDQAYITTISRLRISQGLGAAPPHPPQPQAQPHQPTEADYQALLTVRSETSLMTSEAMSILPRFAHTSGAELEAHHVPQHVIEFVEQNRDHLQRTAQDQNGFRAGLTSKVPQLDNRAQFSQGSTLQAMARPPQLMANHQLQQMQRHGLAPGQGKPNTLQPTQLYNNGVGPLVRPSTAHSMNASSVPSMGTQIAGASSNGGAQGQSASLNPTGMNSATSNALLTQSAGSMPIRRPTPEELMIARRWVEEQKRIASAHLEGVAGYSPVPESDIPEYRRNLERLDKVLTGIEQYIHIAYATLKKDDVVRRMFTMMASTKVQLEEMHKPNPRYILELHTIRGMIQEADNMDKGLKTVLGFGTRQSTVASGNGPPAPQQPQQPPTLGTPAPFAPPAPPAVPPASAAVSRPPPLPSLQSGHRKKLSQAQVPGAAVSTPTPPPVPTASTPTPQATTAPSPQTPKSPKGKAAAKQKPPSRRKVSAKANSFETPTTASVVPSTPTSSTPMDTKGGGKRVHDDDADGATPGAATAPSSKRVKSDWEGTPNEEVRKRDEQADNAKTDEQALAFVEHVTKFIDENPESAEAASNALDEILRIYPPAADIDDATMVPSFGFGDLPSTSPPHPLGNDVFGEFIDLAAFDDTPTPDLVAGSSTNPSPESASDQDHPHMGHAGSPQVSNAKPEDMYDLLRPNVMKDIAGGDTMFHQTPGWNWDRSMETPDQAWAIS
ncbi:hypothetical protein BJV78DRAFT_1224130 [Lactifluus subvellereus]|nr:hypothetical protein BJV78DRAFT_1224130 [Lactifluus subvellereus]